MHAQINLFNLICFFSLSYEFFSLLSRHPSFHHRSLRQDQAPRQQGKAHREEEEDKRQDVQPQSVLQRVVCLHSRAGDAPGWLPC